MEAGETPPGPDLPARVKMVHQSSRTRVTRLFLAGRTVIRKDPLGPDAERRLRHEATMLGKLRGVAGVAQPAEEPQYPGSVVLEDAGLVTLAAQPKPVPARDLVRLADGLARAVAEIHRRGMIHRDITPANIVISGDGVPCLVDFALSILFAEMHPEFTHYSEIAGTLAYLAPEQTGRTGQPVDQRADLYALGATLYELATGGPPFGTGDPLRLIHDHLARMPAPPAEVNPALPAPLSEIIMHLLEKEPDNRYQTADGVIHDLEQLRNALAGAECGLRVGEHDVPLRLLPPSRLAGRDEEVAALETAFEDALQSRRRGVLVSGAAGVGKTALIDQLRPVVTGSDGWFVAGKFDQYRRDLEFDAGNQAFRALGRLLLAEPEDELAQLRERMLTALGPNAGLMAAVVPELAALLAVPPDPGDPLTAQARAQRAAAAALRAVASRKRPVVMVLDDLQWAGRTPLGFVDLVLSEGPIEGLLLVGAYRDDEVDAAHPLAAPLARWLDQPTVLHLPLANLPEPSLGTMVAEMLHARRAAAADLVQVIEPHTRGNPFETVELLNALRRDGLLTASEAGWRWDHEAVRAHLGQSELGGLLAARVAALPPVSAEVIHAMACLGGRAEVALLQTATGETASALDQALAPALEEGLLVVEPGVREAVRFRHDRIRDAAWHGLDASQRRSLQLAMARRLAVVPELFAVAAEQYVTAADAVHDAAERRQVVDLLRRTSDQASLIGDHALVNALLSAALQLIDPDQADALVKVHTARHAALFSLGRFDEADEDYRIIAAMRATAMQRPEATALQVRSLTHRQHLVDAIDLGLAALGECGIAVPPEERLGAVLDQLFENLFGWLDRTRDGENLALPDVTDPGLVTAGRLLDAMLAPAFFAGDPRLYAWLSLEALRIWTERGPGPTLIGASANAAFQFVAQRGDYTAAYRAARRILALGESRGYTPGTSHARLVYSLLNSWHEPIEDAVQASQAAREGLIAGGDLANAGYTLHGTMSALLDCGPTLDALRTEVEAGLAFERRTGGEQAGQWLDSYQWLAGALRGTSSAGAGEAIPVDRYAGNPLALNHAYISHAVAAAIFGDVAGLARHARAAMPLLTTVIGYSISILAYPLLGLALAWQSRESHGDEREALLSELDEVMRWLAARAADAPDNFLHLLRLLEAERAWTTDDFRAAALAYDAARREVAQRHRPWHRALITERAARFYLAHGLEHAGHDLLAQARQMYAAWGATAKADQLDWAYPALRESADATAGNGQGQPDELSHRRVVTTGTIDLLGIVSTSQALSSETSIARLHTRVAQVLGAMTGATGVHLVLWDEERQDWLPVPDSDSAPADGADQQRPAPMSVLRYAERTRVPLVVSDAVADDRFARDPYFADVDWCSLLAVPIVSRGALRAVLLLENHLIRGAFTTARLDAVALIAGQLAVSLDNAQLYAEFRRIADEQAALRRVATLVAQGAPPELVFGSVAEEVGRLLAADSAILVRYYTQDLEVVGTWIRTGAPPPTPVGGRLPLGGNNVTSQVHRTGQPARFDYTKFSGVIGQVAAHNWGLRMSIGVPVSVEGRVWGSMVVAFTHKELLPTDTEKRLAGFTELVATAIANAESQAEVAASRARIVAAADHARRRIERDLHDGAQQRLVSLELQLRGARAAVPPESHELGASLEHIEAGLSAALGELREIARGIHPAILADGGLRPALRALARRSPVPVDLEVPATERLPEQVEVSAYYVVAEALTNAAKHARASAVSVELQVDGDALLVSVRDDGAGGANFTAGTGLSGLKDRVEAIGGRIFLDSLPGAGTSLRVELPLLRGCRGCRRAALHGALADPARLRITDLLADGDASPSELAGMLAMPSNLLAHHLRVLENAGLVARHQSEGDKRRAYLRLVPGTLDALAGPPERSAQRVLFVCTANSARSHLAAALWRRASRVPATSAGTHPADAIDPGAIDAAGRHQLPLPGCGPGPSVRSSAMATWSSRCATWRTRISAAWPPCTGPSPTRFPPGTRPASTPR
ncbi:MAG TPA: AAA family ATPase [Trebonia sp.]